MSDCGFVSLPIRTCEVCGKQGVMWTVESAPGDEMVLCSEDKRMVEALRGSHVELPPIEDDPVARRLGLVPRKDPS